MSERIETRTSAETGELRAIVDGILATWSAGQEGDIRLDASGEALIALRDDVQVSLQVPEDCRRVLAFAPIAPLPEDYRARVSVIEDVLRFNLTQQTLAGGAIGVDPDASAFFFATSAPAPTFSETALEEMLEAAFVTVVALRDQIGFDPDADMSPPEDDIDDDLDQLLRA